MDLNLFEEDDDEEILNVLDIIDFRIPRRIYPRHNHFFNMNDLGFYQRFRLTKLTVLELLPLIEQKLEYMYDTNYCVSPINQLLATLRFYATGEHLKSIADFSGMHYSTVSRIIVRVSEAIASLCEDFVKFPRTPEEIRATQTSFYRIARFPRAIGAIDCTHVKIQSPGGDDAEVFRNRKSYFSFNVQAICNANLEITNVVARWPGSAHDVTVFNNSRIRAEFELGAFRNCVLIGDSGYQNRPYLLTPFLNPGRQAEQLQ